MEIALAAYFGKCLALTPHSLTSDFIVAGKIITLIGYVIFFTLNFKLMGNLLYVLAVILIVGWLLAKFAFAVTSGLIHILLVVAVIIILLKLIGGNKSI